MDINERNALARVASAYKPETDEKTEQVRALGERMTPMQRMAVGYQDSARTAADKLNQENN